MGWDDNVRRGDRRAGEELRKLLNVSGGLTDVD
jgi:hypothetical protein